ncbi:diguanylate cyclase [Deinococcus sp. MIMF12]|uniref:Diguanylate cyclase n=1 Tax=Deinococcus rhizophilus TaxID=3049544 RepID=A0ABT7JJD5_9DEIO|nr:HD domain-containing phosphohydrolase [Deinococcus rhizophilus]MDL2345056.1 diguanylate cyclase [Deinococcus rhizophilus]
MDANAALMTLGGMGLVFGGLWMLVLRSGPQSSGGEPLVGTLWLSLTVPVVAVTVWLVSTVRSLALLQIMTLAVTTGALADWLWFEALSSFYGETPSNDAVELGLGGLLVLGLLGTAFLADREARLQRWREHHVGEVDPLTGLLNRRGITAHYQGLPPGTPVTVVMADLNDLKSVNDTGGHGAGDVHIRAVARAIEQAVPFGSAVGRWGGDEFVALVTGLSPAQVEAGLHAARLTSPRPRPSLSAFAAGVVQATAGEPLDRVLALADQRLYDHKAQEREAEPRSTGERSVIGLEEFSQRLELLGTPEEVLEVGLDLARELLGFEGLTYYAHQDGSFQLIHFKGPPPYDLPMLQATDRLDRRPGLVEWAASSNSTVWSADYPASPHALGPWVELGLKTVVVTPVRCRRRLTGVLGLINFSTWRAVTPQVRRLLEAVALRLSHTLERLVVLEEARSSLEGGMLGLGLALEARDLETAGHTGRVVALAERMGRELGLSGDQLSELRQGAYLHDIGKLAIPDAVLLKPGRLDPHEWALMQTHAEQGARIASGIPGLSPGALNVIRSHHERWDGQGYPEGLSGEQIPLLARIFAVCDVYDALTSERPYKRAWSPQAALAEIRAQRGRHFDPQVVQALLAVQQQDASS